MATSLVMPALEMAQETGILVRWLKRDGETVTKGEPVMEVETDKVTVEIEAPGSGILGGVLAREGDVIPVGQTIAWILSPGEAVPAASKQDTAPAIRSVAPARAQPVPAVPVQNATLEVSPLARRMAEEHGIDLAQLMKPGGKRIEKADVVAYLEAQAPAARIAPAAALPAPGGARLSPASPKARRLAGERGLDLAALTGSGPEGAVLTADVLAAPAIPAPAAGIDREAAVSNKSLVTAPRESVGTMPRESVGTVPRESVGTMWRVMAEHMTASWTTVPHFYLAREVDASRLVEWRGHSAPPLEKRSGVKLTYTDLLVKLLAVALRDHPRLNAAWVEGGIRLNPEINVGIATAVDDGLIVPVIQNADRAALSEIAAQRTDLVRRAHERKLRPADISGGTITLTNLGMYNVDAFNAIVNTPQAAILAVGRIAERVVPVEGLPAVRPMLVMTLSCDHRVVDGARAAQFLNELATLVEDPWRLLL